jgi:hypothetical protein
LYANPRELLHPRPALDAFLACDAGEGLGDLLEIDERGDAEATGESESWAMAVLQ